MPRNAGWREQCNYALRFARDIAVVEPRLVSVSPAPVNGGSERERERKRGEKPAWANSALGRCRVLGQLGPGREREREGKWASCSYGPV